MAAMDIGLTLSMKKAKKKKGKMASEVDTSKSVSSSSPSTGGFPSVKTVDTESEVSKSNISEAAAEMSGMKPRKKKRAENLDKYDSFSKDKGYYKSEKYKKKGYTGE